jgi:hypothetical protein
LTEPFDRTAALPFEALFRVHDHRDTEGRAIGEHRASPPVRETIPAVLKQCPYEGSRYQHAQPMNVSALKQLTKHWDDILAGIGVVRRLYLQHHGLVAVTEDLVSVAIGEAIAAIPSYLMFRVEQPVADGDFDPRVAGMYKVIIGINRVYSLVISGHLMTSKGARTRLSSSEDIDAFAEFGGFLIGAEQVCAGSGRQITEAIEELINGTRQPTPWASTLETTLAPTERFFAFADGMRRLEASKFLMSAATALALMRLHESLTQALTSGGTHLRELHATIGTLLEELDPSGSIRNFGASRTPDQLDRLLRGWFELAGGAPSEWRPVGETSHAAVNRDMYPEAVRGALGATLATLVQLEHDMQTVTEANERQVNAALGRARPDGATGSIARRFTALAPGTAALGDDVQT